MVNILSKSLCENCFAEIDSEPCPECGYKRSSYEQDRSVLPIGSVLEGRYMIGRVLGKGGFGITYLAYDMKLGYRVAIKEYYPLGAAVRNTENLTVSAHSSETQESFRIGAEKFYSEARLVAELSENPNIVSVSDVFYENETVYFIMGYLQGMTLKSYIEKYGTISEEQAVYIAGEISNALISAHDINVLHRDISPDNIMVCRDGTVKLLDFGAARQVFTERSSSFSVILKQGYAPPEQYQKKGNQGPWTDIYSLGATIYYALTRKLLDDPITRLSGDDEFEANNYKITSSLWEIIKKATMLQISERYQNIYEFMDELDGCGIVPKPLKRTDKRSGKSRFGSVGRKKTVYSESSASASSAMEATAALEKNNAVPDMNATVALKENTDMNATVALEPDMDVTMPLGGNAVSDMNATVALKEKNSPDMNATVALKENTDMNATVALEPDMNVTMPLGGNAVSDMNVTMPIYGTDYYRGTAQPAQGGIAVGENVHGTKKRNTKRNILIFAVLLAAVIILINIITRGSSDYSYLRREEDDGIAISKYKGNDISVEIPSEIGGKTVVSICYGAFEGKDIESVIIPDSVIEIVSFAFSDCKSLKNVEIPDSVTKIDDYAFSKCDSLKSITIPDSVEIIGTGSFGDCTGLESMTIPDSVKEIGQFAFANCPSLKKVSLPADCKVDDTAFFGSDNVKITIRGSASAEAPE